MSGIQDRSIPLNEHQLAVCWTMYQKETTVRACVNRILGSLFSAGIVLNNESDKLKEDFKEHLAKKWVPFACETVRNYILYGFSPYLINKEKDPKTRRIVKYPTCVPITHIQVRVEVDDDYQQQFKVFKKAYNFQPIPLNASDPRVKLSFYENCNRPDPQGRLHSNMSTLVEDIQNCDEFLEYALRAESYTSHPTLFVQTTPETRKFEEISHLRAFDDEFVEESRTTSQTANMKRRYDQMNVSQTMAPMEHSKPVYSSRTGRMLPNHEKVWRNNIFSVPDNCVLANNVPLPQTRGDLLAMETAKQERICSVIGVPRSILMNDLAHSSAGLSDLASATFRRTIDGYRVAVLNCLNEIYREIYKDDEQEDILNIPGLPLLTVESIVAVYERGVINAPTMARFMCNALNCSPNEIDDKRVSEMDDHFMAMMKMEEMQTEANVASTTVTAKQQQAKEAESGQQTSKKMRVEMERTGKVGGGNAK